jgi:peptidoglycan/LPS O-acetylase OafA/YrhL
MWAIIAMTSRGGTPEISYRADIDGLRAIAVLSVIGFHVDPRLVAGGFVGVDVFFVISGFLISSLILNGLKDGTFSYAEFYGRRIRRIFPALIVVLLAVWGLGWFALGPSEFAALGKHIGAGAAFAANIMTYAEVGYFDAPASTKPLLHLWSLGVEEQFYIVFPGLLALIWRYRAARLFLALIGIASFALNVAVVGHHPSFAFYLPMTRFWEFIAGALLSFAPIARPEFDWRMTFGPLVLTWRNALPAIGLLLIFAGFGVIPTDFYPGWWALLPVFGTFFVIGAGQGAWVNRKILANPKLVFIGLISYPLYLWHWPLIVIGRALVRFNNPANDYTRTTAIIAVALAFVLAWLTYQFIERPIRARRPLVTIWRIAAASTACLALVALLGFATVQSGGLPTRYPQEVQALLTPLTLFADYPPADETKNSTGPLLVTFGDSHAWHLTGGLHRLQNERTFRHVPIDWGECAPVGYVRPVNEENCSKLTTANDEEFSRLKPDIVVIAAFWFQHKHIERLSETLRFFQRIGVRRIIVIGEVPYWPQPPQTMLYKAYRADPLHRIPKRLFGFEQDTLKVDQRLKEITSKLGITFISAYDVLCNEHGCLARLGNAATDIIQVDSTHFSAAGSWFLISHIANQIFN